MSDNDTGNRVSATVPSLGATGGGGDNDDGKLAVGGSETLQNDANATDKPDNDNDDDSEEEDDDYDPTMKPDEPVDSDSDGDHDDEQYDAITATNTQVRTRSQRVHDTVSKKPTIIGQISNDIDFTSMFNDLKTQSLHGKSSREVVNWGDEINDDNEAKDLIKPHLVAPELQEDDDDKIWIKTSYTFAGKVVTESKQVDINSAEAKAYLNSTGLQMSDDQAHRSSVPVLRTPQGFDHPIELKIKLKRPSLIDKFLHGNKQMKLSTLEKSRLDWASFVDKNKIQDDLKLHNKDGYLEKQDFLGRLDAKQEANYEKVKEADRIRRWQQQDKL